MVASFENNNATNVLDDDNDDDEEDVNVVLYAPLVMIDGRMMSAG